MSGFHCHPCLRSFRLFQHYQDHMIHSAQHHYCAPCNEDFGDKDAKQKHLRHYHFVCPWCHTEVGNYNAHFLKHHVPCEPCKIYCADSANLHNHCQREHSGVYCSPCRRLFANPNALNMHRKGAAHAPKAFRCPGRGCERSFVSASALIQHFEADTCRSGYNLEDVDRDFSLHCDRYQLLVRKELISPAPQIRIIEDEHGRYPCRLCSKSFRSPGELRTHFKSPKHKNGGRKPYNCPACADHYVEAYFYSLGNVLLHMETTACEKPFEDEVDELVDQLMAIVAQTT